MQAENICSHIWETMDIKQFHFSSLSVKEYDYSDVKKYTKIFFI